MSDKMKFFEMSGAGDGRLRIVVDSGEDEPPFMQSIGRCKPGTPMFRIASAVALVSDPERDKNGLYWTTNTALKRALVAARKAAKAEAR